MENKKDLTKTPLVDLLNSLSLLNIKLMIEKDRANEDTIEKLKISYNEIIMEITRRFPPLSNDVNFQPKVLKKKK